jgi:small subunit ribosomal protein S6
LKQYEAMFLFDPTFAADFSNAEQEVDRIMGRAEAKVILCRLWEERRLAYEIKKRKRGCYVLVYFECDPLRIVGIERDCQLAENILRILISQAEGISREWMEKQMPAKPVAAKPSVEQAVGAPKVTENVEQTKPVTDEPPAEVATAEVADGAAEVIDATAADEGD